MEVSPAESGSTEIINAKIDPVKICLAEISLTNVGPTEVWFTEECKIVVSLAGIGLVKVEVMEVCPVGISLSMVGLYIWMLQSPLFPRGSSRLLMGERMSMDKVVLGSESA